MRTQLIKLKDFNIIVSDEEIKEGDLSYNVYDNNFIVCSEKNKTAIQEHWNKVIASENSKHTNFRCFKEMSNDNIDTDFPKFEVPLPSIDYNGLEEDFGVVDIEKQLSESDLKSF